MTEPASTYVAPGDLIATIDRERGAGTRIVRTTLTVELAQALLDRYTEARRPLNERVVAHFVRRIEHPDPEGGLFEQICVAPDGATFVGQHLLTAVIRAGRAVDGVWVVIDREVDPLLRGGPS